MVRLVDYHLSCEEHRCPMIQVEDDYQCLFDFVSEHLAGGQVLDLVPDGGDDHPGALVFADGHTLPLLCPHCAKAAYLDDPAALLAEVAQQYLVALDYSEDDDGRNLLLLFAPDPEADLDDEHLSLLEIATHPDSARRLTCPAERRALQRRGHSPRAR